MIITENFEGLVQIQYRIFKLRSPKIDITTYLSAYPSFTTKDRILTELDIKAKIEIVKDLSLV